MKNNYLSQVKQWIKEEGATAPLLATAYDEACLFRLVDETTKWLIDSKLSTTSDIIICQTDKVTISIKQIRELLNRLSYQLITQRRLMVIQGVEKLSLPAANALLKSLEEAPINSRYLLTTRSKRNLLPTILSRCVIMPIEETLAATIDKNFDPYEKITWLQRVGAAGNMTDDEINDIIAWLDNRLRQDGPTSALKLAMKRAVDYYRIKSIHGNEKLAKEVLMASLPQK